MVFQKSTPLPGIHFVAAISAQEFLIKWNIYGGAHQSEKKASKMKLGENSQTSNVEKV